MDSHRAAASEAQRRHGRRPGSNGGLNYMEKIEALNFIEELSAVRFFPVNSASAKAVLAKRLMSWCGGAPNFTPHQQARWLIDKILDTWETGLIQPAGAGGLCPRYSGRSPSA